MPGFSTWSIKSWRNWIVIYTAFLILSYLSMSGHKENEPVQGFYTSAVNDTTVYISGLDDTEIVTLQDSILSGKYSYLNYYRNTETGRDYSAESKSAMILNKIDSSHPIDLVAFGFGAPIASELALSDSMQLRSMVLVDPRGITEYELLGGTHLNRAVYAVGAIGEWILYYLLPHFGLIPESRYNKARALLDTDYQQLRDNYNRVDVPVTILLSKEAGYSTEGVAYEIRRLIPQSEIRYLSDEETITPYINTNNSGPTILREVQARLPFSNEHVAQAQGWTLAGLMILIIFSTFVTEDLTCIGAGLLAARGIMGFFPAMLACLIGIFIGDLLLYAAGRWLGASSVRKAPFKWFITEKDLEKSYHWFQAKGPAIIIISRFIPGTRFPTYFSAGIIGAGFWMFMLYFGVASLLWTPALVGLSMVIGQELIQYFYLYQEYAVWVLLAMIVSIFFFMKVVVPLYTYRGRRMLYGKLKRIFNWEFWPVYVIYLPVIFHLIKLSIRYRSLTVFTLSNPGIEDGGFIGESKSKILQHIRSKAEIAPFIKLEADADPESRWEEVKSFMTRHEISIPLVLKPDAGERGEGVMIVNEETELMDKVMDIREDQILQQYVAGKEYGVFYYRYPGEKKGHIFSITRKELLRLEGDGTHSLEELILKDSRAVCLAQVHFKKHYTRLYDIPEKGEGISLVEIGTHARGALFFDAEDLITPELTEAIDRISQSFDGFYFGRYDLKVSSEEDLKTGRNLKVIELNGVTSESTNIYDPKHSFLDAVQILNKQWDIAFEIAEQNRKKGMQPTPAAELLRKLG